MKKLLLLICLLLIPALAWGSIGQSHYGDTAWITFGASQDIDSCRMWRDSNRDTSSWEDNFLMDCGGRNCVALKTFSALGSWILKLRYSIGGNLYYYYGVWNVTLDLYDSIATVGDIEYEILGADSSNWGDSAGTIGRSISLVGIAGAPDSTLGDISYIANTPDDYKSVGDTNLTDFSDHAKTGTAQIWNLRGLHIRPTGANDTGFIAAGSGAGFGMYAHGGANTSAFKLVGDGTGSGIEAVAGASGYDILGDVQGSLSGSVNSVTESTITKQQPIYNALGRYDGDSTLAKMGTGRVFPLRGFHIRAIGSDDTAFIAGGSGAGFGMFASGGTNTSAFKLVGSGTGSGIEAVKGASGYDILGNMQGYTLDTTDTRLLTFVGDAPGSLSVDMSGITGSDSGTVYGAAWQATKDILSTGADTVTTFIDTARGVGTEVTADVNYDSLAGAIADTLAERGYFPGIGDERCTVLVLDDNNNPVAGVGVNIYNTAGSARYARWTTNTNGFVYFNLDTLTYYRMTVKKSLYAQDNEYDTLTVPIGGVYDTITITAYSVTAPEDPTLVNLWGAMSDMGAKASAGQRVTVWLNSGNQIVYNLDSTEVFDSSEEVLIIDTDGVFQKEVPRSSQLLPAGLTYIFVIRLKNGASHRIETTAPDSTTFNIFRQQ